MRFEFCGNTDCPEWVLAEVALLNRMSAIKLKLAIVQIVKKLCGQAYDYDKIAKLCRDQKFDPDETKVVSAIVEFLLSQAVKHQVSDKIFSKDLLQMGVAVEIANSLVKTMTEQGEILHRMMKVNTMRVSQIQGLDYSLSYVMASSTAGAEQQPEGGVAPMDIAVKINLDIKEFPKVKGHQVSEAEEEVKREKDHVASVKMAMTRDKFLQFTRDMKQALALQEAAQEQAQQMFQ